MNRIEIVHLPSPANDFEGSLLACFSRIFFKSLQMGRRGFTFSKSKIKREYVGLLLTVCNSFQTQEKPNAAF